MKSFNDELDDIDDGDFDDNREALFSAMVIDPALDERTASLYIELMGNIVTKCE